jgi:hypothetical protein
MFALSFYNLRVNNMTERLTFIVFASVTSIFMNPIVIIVAGLVLAVVILVTALFLLRNSGKNKAAKADRGAQASDWQRQGQQANAPGALNHSGAGAQADWAQQQQPGAWGAQSPAQQPDPWGALTPEQQQTDANTWGTWPSLPQQPVEYGAAPSSTPSEGAGIGGSQPAWGQDATLMPQKSAQDPWGQPPPPSPPNTIPIVVNQDDAGKQPPPPSVPSTIPIVVDPVDAGKQPPQQKEPGQRSQVFGKQARNLTLEDLQFTAFHQRVVSIETWNTLLVYAYIESALKAIHADVSKYQDELGPFPGKVDALASHPVTRGIQITIVPTCQGITFNPERVSFIWIEDWYQERFRFRADRTLAGSTRNIDITIYVGPLIIASLKIWLRFVEQPSPPSVEDNINRTETSTYYYRRIFTSYSHADSPVVLACRNTYQALGLDVLIDIDNLRSGEYWNAALMRMIDTCDLFQLFWSARSAQSQYVRQEWQYALQHYKGEGFFRPVYWEKPLITPPGELSHLHFEYIQLPKLEASDVASPFDGEETIVRPSSITTLQDRLGILYVKGGKDLGRIYEIRKESLTIGRSRDSDIFLEDLAVSRLHASIVNEGNGKLALKDEGSANGTKVNGQVVNKNQFYPLQEGDNIQIGQTVLVFAKR